MKKVLSAVLALLMVVTGFVFPTAAETSAQAAEASRGEGFDILVTDSETLSGWQSFEGEGLPAKELVAMSGRGNAVSLTHSGIMYAGGGWAHPSGSGTQPTNGVKLAYKAAAPYDISDMNYFVFDIYVSHPDKMASTTFYVELCSSGKNDNAENSICATLANMKGEALCVGWNRIYLSLDSLSVGTGTDGVAMNDAAWNFVRIYNQDAFDAGEELVLAFDNVGFAKQKYTPDLEEFVTQFTIFGSDEASYLDNAASANGTTGRYADKDAKLVYKYPVEQLAKAERVLWTARCYNQLLLEVSVDGVSYTPVYAYNTDLDALIASGDNSGNSELAGWQMKGLPSTDMTFNLTEIVGRLATETSDTLYVRIGDSYPYPIIKNDDGTYTEDTARTSGVNCGSGGQLFAGLPVKLSVSYPWGTVKPVVTDTVSFGVNTAEEKAYLYGSAASFSQYHVRFADRLAYFCYAYPVDNVRSAKSIKWTARTDGQLLLDVSTDFENWTEVYRFTVPVETIVATPSATKGASTETYDITEAILKTATDDTDRVYIRVRDAYPYDLNADGTETTTPNGWGGSVSDSTPIVFTVEHEVDASERVETRNESVFYRFMPTSSTAKTGSTHPNIGTVTTGSEYAHIVTDHYTAADRSDVAYMHSSGVYYFCDNARQLVYAFPVEKGATVTSGSFTAKLGAELSVSISDSPTGPWYEAEVRTADEIASGVAKDAALQDMLRTVDLTAAAASLGRIKGDTVYVRIADSDTTDGGGGRTWGDHPAELACTYTVTETVEAQTRLARHGAHSFTATSATEVTSSNHINIATVTTADEYNYLVKDQYAADNSDKAYMHGSGFYFCDGTRYLMYAFPVADGAVLTGANFEAKMGSGLSVSVSDSPKGPWREVEVRTADEIAAGTSATASLSVITRLVDLTAAVRQIGAFKDGAVYVRIGDSTPTGGGGGQLHNASATFGYTYFWHPEQMSDGNALKFTSGALSLTNDFAINYSMSVPADYTDVELRVGLSADAQRPVAPKVNGTTATYQFNDIPAQRLGDRIYTTLIADHNGVPAIVHKTYSVRQYCENMLSRSDDATLKTLLSDALAYGAAAQSYAQYKTDDLATNVNATLTPSTFDLSLVTGERGISGTASSVVDWYSASLTLDTAMTLNMTFSATSVKGLSVGVQIGDRLEETLTDLTPLGNGLYRVSYPLYAYEFFDTLTAKFYLNGTETGRVLSYSVGGYIRSTYESASGARRALLEAIANYGHAVDAYVTENPDLMGATKNENNMIYSAPTAYVSGAEYNRAVAFNDANTNLTLLQSAMNRAKAGEAVTVATIGGSITAGSSSSNYATKSYSAIFRDWWKTTFPETTVTHVNAGIGATTSYLGVHRVSDHVIAKHPDVCIVEFSVNDYHEELYGETYESLVARLLDEGIAVMLVFTVKESGDSMQEVHSAIGAKYRLPMLSYGDAIFPTVTAGQRAWADISPDNIHPNDYGHAYAGEIIWKYLNSVYAYTPDTVEVQGYDGVALKATPYYRSELLGPIDSADTTLLTPDSLGVFERNESASYSTFAGAWIANAASTSEVKEMTFTATFSRLGMMFLCTTDGLSGACEVLIDGEVVATLNGDFSGGWGNYTNTAEVYRSDEAALHTVTLRMTDPAKSFTLCRILVTDYEPSGTQQGLYTPTAVPQRAAFEAVSAEGHEDGPI